MSQISLNVGTLSHFAAEGADVQGQIDLDRLSDVTVTNLLSGQILRYDGSQSQWVNTFTGSITALENLSDVTITGILDGQVIAYNSATSEWENTSAGTGDVTLNGVQTLTNKTLTQPFINEIKFAANQGSAFNFTPLKITNEYNSSFTPDFSGFNSTLHISNYTDTGIDAINVIQLQTPNQKSIFRLDAYNDAPVDVNGVVGTLNITAGNFVTGSTYKIVSVGTTDFTAIGSPNNTVNQVFTATGAGSGSGTADQWDTGAQNVLFSMKGADDIGFIPADSNGLVVGVKYRAWYIGDTDFTAVGATSVTAGSFVTGTEYTILVPGTTDFTLIGALNSNASTKFIATGAGSGTGTALITEFTCNATGSAGTGIAVDMRPNTGIWNQFNSNTGAQTAPGWQTNLDFQANKIRFHNSYVFPKTDGTANQVLTTDGNNQLMFADGTATLVDGGTY